MFESELNMTLTEKKIYELHFTWVQIHTIQKCQFQKYFHILFLV